MSEKKVGEYVDKYLEIRERAEAIKKRHAEELAPYKQAMDSLEDFFAKYMDKAGLENLKAGGGTAYSATHVSVTTADKKAFFDFVKDNDSWELMEIRPSKSAVQEYLEGGNEPPPGVKVSTARRINVRKN